MRWLIDWLVNYRCFNGLKERTFWIFLYSRYRLPVYSCLFWHPLGTLHAPVQGPDIRVWGATSWAVIKDVWLRLTDTSALHCVTVFYVKNEILRLLSLAFSRMNLTFTRTILKLKRRWLCVNLETIRLFIDFLKIQFPSCLYLFFVYRNKRDLFGNSSFLDEGISIHFQLFHVLEASFCFLYRNIWHAQDIRALVSTRVEAFPDI